MLRDGIEEKQFNQENDSKLKKIAIKRMIQFWLKKLTILNHQGWNKK